jgi:hypothetical protein
MDKFTIKSDDKYVQKYQDDNIMNNLLNDIADINRNSHERNEKILAIFKVGNC